MTDDQLRLWAEAHAPAGSPQAAAVLSLLAERDALRRQVAGHCERIAAQSELLSRRSERPVELLCEMPDTAPIVETDYCPLA